LNFLDSRQEDRILWTEFGLLLIPSCMQFWSVSVVPRYLNFAHLQRTCLLSLCSAFVLSSVTDTLISRLKTYIN
jgi:hypothetical protein